MSAIFNRIKNLFGQGSSALTYGQAKELASDQNPEVRKELAERIDVRPEILYFLAEDPDPIVRCEIAKNEAAPRQADAVLAKDDDIEVRSCLANKIARLAPNLNSMEREDIRHLTVGILEDLARDQVPKIRQILSDTLKDVADAPVSVIRQLAQDDELLVSVPVLENSPVLTDEDLLHIISNLLESKALSAISRRHAVSPGVADAIVDTDSKEAITVLLNNESAQIREETLDLLVDRSRNIEMWQGPLVRRPQLPASVALRLAEFVADKYLTILEGRRDLDAATLKRVKKEVHLRIGKAEPNLVENGGEGDGNPIQINSDNIDIALAAAKRLKREGKLEAKDIESALKTGDRQFVRSALAIRSELSLAVIEKIVKTRSAKGVMAMAWKAGLPMRLATDLQSKLAGISNGDLINPRNGFDYPMNDEELAAELSFFTD
ncbi:MAG: DUF2336 domain-containing protein [Rhodospirillaceae bacterium]|jgi:hypothetical protein|nr:DUF2336 domain-containing protein [Rhodospirillaceae bacterium]MBT7265590.1 DUF2336 domain-containing protein [Rhodospirillaceae bacterium]